MRVLAICVLLGALSIRVFSAEAFTDVPKDHWAAPDVQKLADAGVVRGYVDKTFKGDKPVTRYELAVALERMIEFIRQSEVSPSPQPSPARGEGEGVSPSPRPSPAGGGEGVGMAPTKPGEKSMAFLRDGGFVPKDSPVLKVGGKPVTAAELAKSLASVAARLVELKTPAEDSK